MLYTDSPRVRSADGFAQQAGTDIKAALKFWKSRADERDILLYPHAVAVIAFGLLARNNAMQSGLT